MQANTYAHRSKINHILKSDMDLPLSLICQRKQKGFPFLNNAISKRSVFFCYSYFFNLWRMLPIFKLFIFLLSLGINKAKWKLVFLLSMKTEANHS